MTDKELRKLSKTDLLEILIEQGKEIEKLKDIILKNEEQLESKKIMLNEAGSIAEASLKLNHIFEDAQLAANQYIENIRELSDRQSQICAHTEEESRKKSEQMMIETKRKCIVAERETQEKCNQMIAQAQAKSKAYWTEISSKINEFVKEHTELKEFLSVSLTDLQQEQE